MNMLMINLPKVAAGYWRNPQLDISKSPCKNRTDSIKKLCISSTSSSTSGSFSGGTRNDHFCSLFLVLCDGRHSESVCGTWGELREGHSIGGCGCHSIFVKHHQGLLRADPLDTRRICNLWNGKNFAYENG